MNEGNEGDSGSQNIDINIELSGETDQEVNIDYNITGGTAVLGDDYNFTTGTLTFNSYETTKTLS